MRTLNGNAFTCILIICWKQLQVASYKYESCMLFMNIVFRKCNPIIIWWQYDISVNKLFFSWLWHTTCFNFKNNIIIFYSYLTVFSYFKFIKRFHHLFIIHGILFIGHHLPTNYMNLRVNHEKRTINSLSLILVVSNWKYKHELLLNM